MEERKITVVSSSSSKKVVLMSKAETLGQLKEDLTKADMPYEGLSFVEGLSKTELKDDSSPLPKDVPYRNTTTNELVFMLTKLNKKISSGILSRKDFMDFISSNNLQSVFKEEFNRSYTNAKTELLAEFYGAHIELKTPNKPKASKLSGSIEERVTELEKKVSILEGYNCSEDYDDNEEESEIESSYSDDEIDDMFADI